MTSMNPGSALLPVLVFEADNAAMDTNGTNLSAAIDTLGWEHATIIVACGTVAGTVALQAQTSDASGGTYADVSGALISLSSADDDSIVYGYLDLSAANRYLKIEATVASLGSSQTSVTIVFSNAQYIGDGGPTFAPDFDV